MNLDLQYSIKKKKKYGCMTWLERGVRNTENDLAWASRKNNSCEATNFSLKVKVQRDALAARTHACLGNHGNHRKRLDRRHFSTGPSFDCGAGPRIDHGRSQIFFFKVRLRDRRAGALLQSFGPLSRSYHVSFSLSFSSSPAYCRFFCTW